MLDVDIILRFHSEIGSLAGISRLAKSALGGSQLFFGIKPKFQELKKSCWYSSNYISRVGKIVDSLTLI